MGNKKQKKTLTNPQARVAQAHLLSVPEIQAQTPARGKLV